MKADNCLRDILRPYEKKRPRGHAYMRFRNNNYKFEVDFPNVNERIVESIMQHAIRTLREHNDRAKVK